MKSEKNTDGRETQPEIIALRIIMTDIAPVFGRLDGISQKNRKVLAAFLKHRVSDGCFRNDRLRLRRQRPDTLDLIWADVFGAESASCESALSTAPTQSPRPFRRLKNGRYAAVRNGRPVRQLRGVIGIEGDYRGAPRLRHRLRATELLPDGRPDQLF